MDLRKTIVTVLRNKYDRTKGSDSHEGKIKCNTPLFYFMRRIE